MICRCRRIRRIASLSRLAISSPLKRIEPRCRIHQPQHQPSGGRLAAAGFADQRQRLAARDLEGDVLDRAHHADQLAPQQTARHRKMLDQAIDLKDRRLAHAAASTGAFQQATRWVGLMSRSGGDASRQRPSANGQRGAKRQPFGWLLAPGTVPSIVASRSRSTSRRGIEPSSPMRVGMLRIDEEVARPRRFRRSGRHTSPARRRPSRRSRRDRG